MRRASKPNTPSAAQRLAPIRQAVHCIESQQFPVGPRTLLAGLVALGTLVAVSTLVPSARHLDTYWPMLQSVLAWLSPAAALTAFVGVMVKSSVARTWPEQLSKKLCAYDPVDKDSYRALQQRVAAEGHISVEAVREWLDLETAALRPLRAPDASAQNLVRRKV